MAQGNGTMWSLNHHDFEKKKKDLQYSFSKCRSSENEQIVWIINCGLLIWYATIRINTFENARMPLNVDLQTLKQRLEVKCAHSAAINRMQGFLWRHSRCLFISILHGFRGNLLSCQTLTAKRPWLQHSL